MTAFIRCVTRIPYIDNVNRDVAENVFWFASEDLTVDNDILASDAVARLQTFWQDTPDGASLPMGSYMSRILTRVENGCEILVYDPLDHGAPPFTTNTFTLGAPSGADLDMATEVALCSSYWSSKPPLDGSAILPRPRRQGRIYIGPLTALAMRSSTEGYPLPAVEFVNTVYGATKHIAEDNSLEGGWVVFSKTAGKASIVTNGWVDNAWDTQRRRGLDPTDRSAWDAGVS